MYKILLFHGVTQYKKKGIKNYNNKHLYYDEFFKILKNIKNNYNFYSMDELLYFIKYPKERPKNKFYIVSFDDGFKNNLKACEILSDLNIKSIFYITSGLINKKKLFWVDEIEKSIAETKLKKIEFELINQVYKNFDISNNYSKIKTINFIKKYCKNSNFLIKENIIDQLRRQIKVDKSLDEDYKVLNWKELKSIANHNLFTVGGHSLYHDILTSKNIKQTAIDIKKSIRLLEKNLKIKIQHYSYPEGQANHFNSSVIKVLKRNKILASPSAINGTNSFKTNLFKLKRIMVGFNHKFYKV